MPPENVTGGAIVTYTTVSGIAVWFEVISGWAALLAVVSGIILTWVLIRKHLIETKVIQESGGARKKETRKRKREVEK